MPVSIETDQMKILIAEDDFIARKVIAKFLEKYGQIDTTDNGQDTVRAFNKALSDGTPYDLVCLDIMMPKMNGHEALVALRKVEEENGISHANRCIIVMTTALDDSQNILKSFDNQCSGYITKPYSFDKLQTELDRIIKGSTH